ncbi:MAG: lipoyl synthase [Planctomycetota bacterium]
MPVVQPDPSTPHAKTLARHPRPAGGDPVKRLDKPTLSLSDRVINNQTQQLRSRRKPSWLRAKVPGGQAYLDLKANIEQHGLFTVCQEANCPNMGECWARGVATIMILGDTCTRACGFCNVKTGKPPVLDTDEPRRVAESMRLMVETSKLKHVVITSVNRDELRDGGAAIWAETITRTRDMSPGLSIEVLIPDFMGNWDALQDVIDARPEILNHNLETVPRMYPAVRPSAKYDRSVELLRRCKDAGLVTKTGIMVGIGEKDHEVIELMRSLREAADTDILTIGQYLQPTPNHLPIDRWVEPSTFEMYKERGLELGFKVVESGPMVRSSYLADKQADALTDIEARRSLQKVDELIAESKKNA